MKKFIVLFGLAISLSSCRSYLMNTVSSMNTLKRDAAGVLNLENDSLTISYNFAGENSPLTVEVYNKLQEPLYVNWERSALIAGDKAYSFVDDEIKISGESSSSNSRIGKASDLYTNGNILATARLSKNESFIPPKSKVRRTTYKLNQLRLDKIQKNLFKKTALNYSDGTGSVNSKSADFTLGNSPLKFRTYLTLYTLKDNLPSVFPYEQDFYISNITKSFANPKKLIEYEQNAGNVIVNSKITGFGKTMVVVALVTVTGGAAAAGAVTDNHQPISNRK